MGLLFVDNLNYRQLKKLQILFNTFEEIKLLYRGQNLFY